METEFVFDDCFDFGTDIKSFSDIAILHLYPLHNDTRVEEDRDELAYRPN